MELPSGIISDHVGRATLLIIGLGLCVVGTLRRALANSIYLLILGHTTWGFGTALYFMDNTAPIIDLFEHSVTGRVLGLL